MIDEPLVFVRLPQVLAETGLGRTTVYDLIRTGAFPAPIKIGGRTTGFARHEIEEWKRERLNERDGGSHDRRR